MEICGQGGIKDKQTNHPNNCTAKEYRWKQRTVVSQGRGDEPAWGHRETVVRKIVPKWEASPHFPKGSSGWNWAVNGWMGKQHTSRKSNVNKAERLIWGAALVLYMAGRQGVRFGGVVETFLLSCARLQIILFFLKEGKQSQVSGIKKHKQISRLYSDLMVFSFSWF